MTTTSDEALAALVRWVASGGQWRLLSAGDVVRLSLLTCDGSAEMGRLESADPCFAAYVEAAAAHRVD